MRNQEHSAQPIHDESSHEQFSQVQPPQAKQVPYERVFQGHTFVDPYEWLRDAESPEVLNHLEAETEYTQQRTAHLAGLRSTIYNEIRDRVKETDMSVPTRYGDWWYFGRTTEGKSYGQHCRVPAAGNVPGGKPVRTVPADEVTAGTRAADDIRENEAWIPPEISADTPAPEEEVIFDENVEAEGHEFFSLGSFDVSRDGTRLLYAVDTTGDERYTLKIRDLTTGEDLADEVPETFAGAIFDPSNQYVFYITVDEAWRPHKIWRHAIGTDTADDVCIFTEPDRHFNVGIGCATSEKYLILMVTSSTSSEAWVIDAATPTDDPRLVWKRQDKVEYSIAHAVVGGEDRFLITHNRDRDDFDIVDVPARDPRLEGARRVIDSPEGKHIQGVYALKHHILVAYREDGLQKTGIIAIAPAEQPGHRSPYSTLTPISMRDGFGTTQLLGAGQWEQPCVRIAYGSLITPAEIADYYMASGEIVPLKKQQVQGDVDLSKYDHKRIWATAKDGTRIPVSLVWRTDKQPATGAAPTVLYGYGSYEISEDPRFSIARLSLLDRGVVFAVAHVRGGGEMGRHWYEQGKMLQKKNTFTDFIAVAQHLIDEGISSPESLVAQGGSAGGLLMGAIANMAGHLFAGVLAIVPFVDALTSILKPELPLTTQEWEEWGDPYHDPEVYAYMREYSPYENIREQRYPQILAVTSFHDTRVLYVEPAKWVLRLRDYGADAMLKIDMAAGHGGASGRYKAWEDTAFEYAWILDVAGIK